MQDNKLFFDSAFETHEQLPRKFTVHFDSMRCEGKVKTKVTIEGQQIGDIIDDNSREVDFYRFHDVFHFTFASLLGWSPCTRALLKRKRKSDSQVDEIEDGARATITEEAISLMLFNKAKQRNLFNSDTKISPSLLQLIKDMTDSFEVHSRSKKEWEATILKGYELFRHLVQNDGGKIHFNMFNKSAIFEA